MHQTGLRLQEVFQELEQSQSLLPRCLLLNEVGEFCHEGAKEAEAYLRQMLSEGDESERFIAYCYLSTVSDAEEETSAELEGFKENPDNADIVATAEDQL